MRIARIALLVLAGSGLAGSGLAGCGAAPRPAAAVAPAPSARASRASVAAIPAFEPATATDLVPEVMVEPPQRARSGSLPDGALLRALRRHEVRLRHCFVSALRDEPGRGVVKVPVHLHIGARGRVLEARATAGIARLDACVAAEVRRLRFPAPGAPLDVDLPLFFSGS
jgi:hypothetical protein